MNQEQMLAYQKANFSIHNATKDEADIEIFGKYIPLPTVDKETNAYGIWMPVYMCIKYYEKETGTDLSYEMVRDYFSQEREPDGGLRLYNNGLHPEMEAFVDWMWAHAGNAVDTYWRALSGLYSLYYFDHREEGFKNQDFSSLSPQMYDELAKKEADPNYEMDLMGLQQQGA